MPNLPFSSLAFVVSIIIFILHFLFKKFKVLNVLVSQFSLGYSWRKNGLLLSGGIIAAVIYLVLWQVMFFINKSEGMTAAAMTTANIIPTAECVEQVFIPNKKPRVILRLDDVQANWHTELSILMMNEAIENGLPVVAGIIPKGLRNDLTLVRYMRNNICNVEASIHGWDHVPVEDGGQYSGEFAFLEKDEALSMLTKAKRVARKYTGQTPVSFIPPRNQVSTGTIEATKELNIPITSVVGDNYYDIDSAQWDYSNNIFVSAEDVVESCEKTYASGDNLCVIMLHPQDLLNELGEIVPERLLEYQKLISYFSHERFVGTTFRQVAIDRGEDIHTRNKHSRR